MRLWSLTVGVSAAHVAVLWGAHQWSGQDPKLLIWDRPEFTHQVGMDTPPLPLLNPARSDEKDLPLSTIGQTLQVRTLVDASLGASLPKVAASSVTSPITKTAPPSTSALKKTTASTPTPDKHSPPPTVAVESTDVTVAAALAVADAGEARSDAPSPTVLAALSIPTSGPVESENKKTPAPEVQTAPPKETPAPAAPVDLAAAVAHWPPATRLNYKLHGHYRGDLYGKAAVLWQRQGTSYQAQVEVSVSLLFNLRMTSQGKVTPQALWPEVYQEERRGKVRGIKMGDAVVQLDNGETTPRPKNLQDTASQFVQLAQDFAHQRRPLRVGAVIPVPLARPGGVDEWVYDVVALDTLNTPLGQVPAFHLQPRPLAKARSGVDVDMWFAPSLHYLPARIRLNLGPDVWLDLLLESIDQAEAPTAKS